MKRARATLLSSVVSLLLPSGLPAQEQRFVGCYEIRVDWAGQQPGADSIYYMPPARIRLHTAPGKGLGERPRGYAVETTQDAMPSLHQYSWWTNSGTDGITVTWSTGFTGIVMQLTGTDTLRGSGRTFIDVVPGPLFTPRITAPRVNCDAALNADARMAYRYSRVIHLANRDSLILDERVNANLPISGESPRTLRVEAEPVGLYSGAHNIEIWIRPDSTVRSIRLSYPPTADFDELLARLQAAHGQQTSEPNERRPRNVGWSSRLMYVSLSQDRGPGTDILVALVSQRR